MSECELCNDSGYKMENNLAVPCLCPTSIDRRIAEILPERFRSAKLKDVYSQDSRNFASEWLNSQLSKSIDNAERTGLLIMGGTGTGKTYLSAAICRDLVERGIEVKYCRFRKFILEMRETYRTNCSEETVLRPLERVPFLILDDLLSGSASDHERRCTLELLELRLNACRPAIVNTNFTLQQISDRVDDRIASRLSTYTVVLLTGDDRRARR